ncbi:MAG: hypothetical protein FJX84_09895 [Bacteroidetes bacterium]|nr:hypothetical protein [Bacteroidota bacterium]
MCSIVSIWLFIIGYFVDIQIHGEYYRNMALDKAVCQDLLSSKDYTDVGGNMDIEYCLDESEDFMWVENVTSHRVSSSTYSDLEMIRKK